MQMWAREKEIVDSTSFACRVPSTYKADITGHGRGRYLSAGRLLTAGDIIISIFQ